MVELVRKGAFESLTVLDGGLATETERRGVTIEGNPLWSAQLLHSDPCLLESVHSSFLEHGADIITTASYQASVEGFVTHLGVSEGEALDLIGRSVSIAIQARDKFVLKNNYKKPLIAGSVGPYGAYLADGSEYTGCYVDHMTHEELINWHRPRVTRLLESGVDLLAFETIPAQKEAEALMTLLTEFPAARGWLAFSCKDEVHSCYGDSLHDAIRSCCGLSSQLVAVGINCTKPCFVEPLLRSCVGSTALPLIVYPNSGENWTRTKGWSGVSWLSELSSFLPKWVDLGARVIGGCCRVTPCDIKLISDTLKTTHSSKKQ